jgi:hypothetical protein
MAFLVITAVAYLAGAASGAFLVIVISIRRGDCPERITGTRSYTSGDFAQHVLYSGSWPDVPVCRPGTLDK